MDMNHSIDFSLAYNITVPMKQTMKFRNSLKRPLGEIFYRNKEITSLGTCMANLILGEVFVRNVHMHVYIIFIIILNDPFSFYNSQSRANLQTILY